MTVHVFPAILVFDKKGYVLLLKRAAWKKFSPNLLGGIGGKVEKGDSSIENALQREFEEETNIPFSLITNIQLKVKLFIVNRDENDYAVYFYTGTINRDDNLDLTCTEGELGWYQPATLKKEEMVKTLGLCLPYIVSEKNDVTVCLFDERRESFITDQS